MSEETKPNPLGVGTVTLKVQDQSGFEVRQVWPLQREPGSHCACGAGHMHTDGAC